MVPLPVRERSHVGLAAAAGGHLIDVGGGQRLPVAGSKPQLRPPGPGVAGAGAQVPVEVPGGLADLDDPVLAADGGLRVRGWLRRRMPVTRRPELPGLAGRGDDPVLVDLAVDRGPGHAQ
jgi:hypothetical protein